MCKISHKLLPLTKPRQTDRTEQTCFSSFSVSGEVYTCHGRLQTVVAYGLYHRHLIRHITLWSLPAHQYTQCSCGWGRVGRNFRYCKSSFLSALSFNAGTKNSRYVPFVYNKVRASYTSVFLFWFLTLLLSQIKNTPEVKKNAI